MTRQYKSFKIDDPATFKQKMLNWANKFNICCLLDDHNYNLPYHSYDCLVAAGSVNVFEPQGDFFHSLAQFYLNTKDWILGHFNYDLKNKIEELTSSNVDHTGFPEAFLFVPRIVLRLQGNVLSIGVIKEQAEDVFAEIANETIVETTSQHVTIQARVSKQDYVSTIQNLKEHILRGDCYEINYCHEFYAENVHVNPITVYHQLTTVSPNPFSSYYKLNNKYLLCASPERYLKKEGNQIISQPIKGTSQRDLFDKEKDENYRNALLSSIKDRSENVMIVDLVRNDLSKVCREGTVKVKELFGIYSFPQVHQMISTIEGELNSEAGLSDILKATFPMGSMTGAPKKKVMELIEKYEVSKRGIYSGTLGYITPDKDFDFNVVIRSLVYNRTNKYLSYHVGSAITYSSDAEKEYDECLLKAAAIKKVLQ